jgi:hypothetical protein
MNNLFGPRTTSTSSSTVEDEKKRAALAKIEEEQIQRDKKRLEKKKETMSYQESFSMMWNVIVITVVGLWDGLKFAWVTAMAFMNLAGKLSEFIVNHFGYGNSVIMGHNKRVAESAFVYILMLPFYIMAGITALFIYNIKDETGERVFGKDKSFLRKWMYPTKTDDQWKQILMTFPLKFVFGPTRLLDSSTYEQNAWTTTGRWLKSLPYIASFFLPILFLISAAPTIRPSILSIALTTAAIAYFVGDGIMKLFTGSSISEHVEKGMPSQDTSSSITGDQLNGHAEELKTMGENTSTMVVVAKVGYSLLMVIVGILAIIPAAYCSSFYIWFVTMFAFFVHNVPLKKILKELNENSKSQKGVAGRIIPGMTDWKGTITSIICILISMSVLIQIENDTPLFLILSAMVVLSGLAIGGCADQFLNWVAGPK